MRETAWRRMIAERAAVRNIASCFSLRRGPAMLSIDADRPASLSHVFGRFDMQAMLAAMVLAAFLIHPSAGGAAQRTFVASNGSDANPCSLVLPCRGFATAITHTDPNGEIIVLDSAGYGAVIITQGVSIIAPPGIYGGMSVFSLQDGVTINTATEKVVLSGLSINGQGGTHGVRVIQAAQVQIEDCEISNMGPATACASKAASSTSPRTSFAPIRLVFM
jgi:hypothetical protein